VVVSLAAAGPAAAQISGSFGKVVDTTTDPLINTIQPWAGINNSGLVAFQAVDAGNRDRYFTGRVGQAPVMIADNPTVGRIYDSPVYVPVSDTGDVPYWRHVTGTSPTIQHHVGALGASFTAAASPTYDLAPVPGFVSTSPNVNSLNQIVFIARTPSNFARGVHVATRVGSSYSYTTIASSANSEIVIPYGGPDLNTGGTAVFKSVFFHPTAGQANGLYVGGGATPLTRIADTTGVLADFGGWPTLNDAGTVLYSASFDDGRSGIFRYENGNTTQIAEGSSTGAFSTVAFSPSLNNLGQIAFWARLADGRDGIFLGPNPDTDAVIEAGDPLDGSTVQFLSISQNALNDAGQLVFTATLTDGRQGVYVFTPVPVPEPAGLLAVAGLGLLVAARLRRRRHRRCAPAAG
jgi:hypothetical protein